MSIYLYSPIALIGDAEIFPWYVIPLFFLITKKHRVLYLATLVPFLVLVYFNFQAAVGFFQLSFALQAAFFVAGMKGAIKERSIKIIHFLAIGCFVLLASQKLSPFLAEQIPNLLSGRDGLGLDHRTGGVRGFAPEPSYMASSLISLLAANFLFARGQASITSALLIFSVFMTGSLMGIGAAMGFVFFYALIASKKMLLHLFEMKISRASIWILSGVFFGMAAVILIAFPAVMRSYDFALILFNEISQQQALDGILAAENTYGSARISEIVESFTTKQGYFLGGEYDKPFSLFGMIAAFISPLHWVLPAAFIFGLTPLRTKFLFLYFILMGPVSNFGFALALFYQRAKT